MDAINGEQDDEKFNQLDNRICGDLSNRLHQLREMALNATIPEDKVTLRIQQLSLSKIMVNIHRKSHFILVTSHCELGQAYLEDKCY